MTVASMTTGRAMAMVYSDDDGGDDGNDEECKEEDDDDDDEANVRRWQPHRR